MTSPAAADVGSCSSSQTERSALLCSCRSPSGPTCTSPSPPPHRSSAPPQTGSGRWAGSERGGESAGLSPQPGNTAEQRPGFPLHAADYGPHKLKNEVFFYMVKQCKAYEMHT